MYGCALLCAYNLETKLSKRSISPFSSQLQSGDLAPYYRLLQMFAYGVWGDYKSGCGLGPPGACCRCICCVIRSLCSKMRCSMPAISIFRQRLILAGIE
eukprot:1147891-Pelagomonas_calceolata.AAC.5